MPRIIVFVLLLVWAGYSKAVSWWDQSRRDTYIAANENTLSPDIKASIKKGKVRVGMSKEQARISWGAPKEIIGFENGRREQWLYRRCPWIHSTPAQACLDFEGDLLINWKLIA